MQILFSESFGGFLDSDDKKMIFSIRENQNKIDRLIEKSAPQFPIDKIAKIDAAVLRQAVYELFFDKMQPPKVIIDESVELAKEFGNDNSASFVNGVLGNILKINEKI